MESKRKPKGSEGGNLQIRDLDAATLETLRELQKHFGVGTNSKAVLLTIKSFLPYMREVQQLRQRLKKAEETIKVQCQLLMQIGKILDAAQLNKMMYDVSGLDEDDVIRNPLNSLNS